MADNKFKAEARSNQRLKKRMAFFGNDDRKGEARKSEETVPDLQYNTIHHYLRIGQGRIIESCFILPL